ncbi:hypothetical protein D9Q98_008987 [Chlorella vulgaris]|uniref:Protein SirB1 N-terminal domain-containing protein n=1 Tax=Chlorella vulgaris TaxID=3077 RepID=A0A9D4TGY3_CHLVU|nr:hypothetical protein D9Q98_008987 [Chlorella vulgaris]
MGARLQLSRPGASSIACAPSCSTSRTVQAPRACHRAARVLRLRTASRQKTPGYDSDEYPVSTPDYPRPRSNAGVADWASRQFRKSAPGNVAKACLLVSLEEEAAAQAAYAEADGLEANHANMRGGVGVASTWSLKRVHNMTNDVLNAFHARLRDLTPMPQPPALLKKASTLAPAVAGQPEVPETPHERHRRMVRSYPLELISAVNQVLFERHGYRRQQAHGDPRNSLLSHVLESGLGSPAAMAVLFQEVCRRSGLDLLPVALEGGRYFVLVPADDSVSLRAAGEAFVVDPYSQGMLLSASEVKELFAVEGELRPCSNAEMIAGVLTVLLELHWCAALGCPPEPLLSVPISLEVALGEYRDVEVQTRTGEADGKRYFTVNFLEGQAAQHSGGEGQWWPARAYNLQRAVVAARKRAWLLPGDLQAQLQYGLLLFFDKQYEEAWQEMGNVLKEARLEAAAGRAQPTFTAEEIQQLEVLLEKCRLLRGPKVLYHSREF